MSLSEPVTAEGLREAEEAMPRTRKFLDLGLMPHLQRIITIGRDDLRKNYDSEGRHFGAPWPLLTEATQEHRDFLAMTFGLSIAPDHPILVNFGDLKESIVEKHGVDHEERVDQFTARIASTHRKGGMTDAMAGMVDRGEGSAPARRLVHPDGGSPAALQLMFDEMRQYGEAVVRLAEEG